MAKNKLIWRIYIKNYEHYFELNDGINSILDTRHKDYYINLSKKYEEVLQTVDYANAKVYMIK